MNRAANSILFATVITGLMVAWAPAIPVGIRHNALFLSLLSWTMAVVFGTVQATRAAWGYPETRVHRASTIVGAIGISLTALDAGSLAVIRAVYELPGLVWNVDWRWAWNHAQAIARFGGVDRALDYSGASIDYHVGPAWLAAATERTLGFGMGEVLFGIVPVLSVLSSAVAGVLLVRTSGLSRQLSIATVGVAFCLPVGLTLSRLAGGLFDGLAHAESWFFSSGLMLNSYMAIAVGLCSLQLILNRHGSLAGILLGALGLAAVMHIKPQFFVGLGVLVGVVGLGRALRSQGFTSRAVRVLLAATGALGLALLTREWLPGSPPGFSEPIWAPGSTGVSFEMILHRLRVPLVLAALAILSLLAKGIRSYQPPILSQGNPELLATVILTILLVGGALTLVSLPLDAEAMARGKTIGMNLSANSFSAYNLPQAFIPLQLLLVIAAVGTTTRLLQRYSTPALLVGACIVALPVPGIFQKFAEPLRAYEAVRDTSLRELLLEIPKEEELVIASDLADPAENSARRLRGMLLTAYGGNVFYASNLWYYHYTHEDSVQRWHSLNAFFGARWSNWHSTWLSKTGITDVLVNSRCVPRWWGQPDIPLQVVRIVGEWTLLKPNRPAVFHDASLPEWELLSPKYGQAPCL